MLKRNLIAATAAALALAAAPAAIAHTTTAGSTTGDPTMNVCLVDFDCTYVNFAHGKPTDVVRHAGTITRWSINVGIFGNPEQVTLRVLRPVHGGAFKAIGASAPATIAGDGVNTFPTHIKVRKGRRARNGEHDELAADDGDRAGAVDPLLRRHRPERAARARRHRHAGQRRSRTAHAGERAGQLLAPRGRADVRRKPARPDQTPHQKASAAGPSVRGVLAPGLRYSPSALCS